MPVTNTKKPFGEMLKMCLPMGDVILLMYFIKSRFISKAMAAAKGKSDGIAVLYHSSSPFFAAATARNGKSIIKILKNSTVKGINFFMVLMAARLFLFYKPMRALEIL